MPRLVAQVAHRLVVVLDAAGHLCLEALESFVGQIEWNADQRRAVGTAPLVAEIYGWPEPNALRLELGVELRRESFDSGALDGESQIGDASAEQCVAFGGPG